MSFYWGLPLSYYFFEGTLWVVLIGLPVFVWCLWQKPTWYHRLRYPLCVGLLLVGLIGWLGMATKWIFILAALGVVCLFLGQQNSVRFKAIITFLAIFFWSLFFYGSFIESNRLIVREFQLENTGLPTMRAIVVGDFHLGPYKSEKWVQKVTNKINQQSNIDVVLVPGDYLYGDGSFYADQIKPLADIKWPLYATLGNHDHADHEPENTHQSTAVRTAFAKYGIRELQNQLIAHSTLPVAIIGVDDNDLGFDDLSAAYSEVLDTTPRILIAHSPDIVQDLRKEKLTANLIVAGHTHCGQIRFPLIGAVSSTIPTRQSKAYERHLYQTEVGSLFVTCGVGEVGPRARFLNPPEIVILDIRS